MAGESRGPAACVHGTEVDGVYSDIFLAEFIRSYDIRCACPTDCFPTLAGEADSTTTRNINIKGITMNDRKSLSVKKPPQASGHIYIYDPKEGTQYLVYGKFGRTSQEIRLVIQKEQELEPGSRINVRVSGDFSPLVSDPMVDQIGSKSVSMKLGVNGENIRARFTPALSREGNFLYATSDGYRGAGIVDHNSPWVGVAVLGILAVTGLGAYAIYEGGTVSGSVKTPAGSAEVTVSSEEGGDDEGNGDAVDGGNGEGNGDNGGDGGNGNGGDK